MTSTSDTLCAVFGVCLVLKSKLFLACNVWLNGVQCLSCHRAPPTIWRRMRLLLRHLGFALRVYLFLPLPLPLSPSLIRPSVGLSVLVALLFGLRHRCYEGHIITTEGGLCGPYAPGVC